MAELDLRELSIMAAHDTAEDVPDLRPVDKVINTSELLNMILANLTPRNIFGIQRVCKAIHCHVHGDTRKAEQLYLSPKTAQGRITCVLTETTLLKSFLSRFACNLQLQVNLNSPILRYIDIRMKHAATQGKVQSWGEMFLTQPPIKEMWMRGVKCSKAADKGKEFHIDSKGKEFHLHDSVVLLSRPDGVRLREMAEAATELL